QRLPVVPWVISGRSRAALHAQAERLAAHLDTHPTLNPVDVGYSLATTRTHFEHRAVIIAETRQDLTDETRALASPTAPAGTTSRAVSGAAAGVVTGTAGANPAVAFLFTGQGSQRTGMGRQLYDTFPLYAHTFDTVTDHLDHHLTHLARQDDQPAPASVRDVVFGTTDPHLIDQTLYTQPALFALQISLYRLIESWGIT
ncbi:acyltransferase domain-containing protein, partial [Planotetraspora sp. A-T 1434]|uniref:CurL C-terminal domain-containing protein n=1 Tax=Planotetraspora sp. A-T 1434 TaxID=2979219 RepID=UPI0021C0D853